jgi:hypothetical protein
MAMDKQNILSGGMPFKSFCQKIHDPANKIDLAPLSL